MKETELDYEKIFKPYCFDFKTAGFDNSTLLTTRQQCFDLFVSLYDESYGTINIDGNLIDIHTGGWSENESVIYEFKKTFWWQSYFSMQASGGHYYFNIGKLSDRDWKIIKG